VAYEYFFSHFWKFDDRQYCRMCDSLNKHDAEEFLIDMRKIELVGEGKHYVHGLAKYYLLEDIPVINSDLRQIVQMNQLGFNHDLRFSSKTYKELQYRDLKDIYPFILDPSKYE